MPKDCYSPLSIDEKIDIIEAELTRLNVDISFYLSPVNYSESISREERLLAEKQDREELTLLKSKKAQLEAEKLTLSAKKQAIIREREEAAQKRRENARTGYVDTARTIAGRLNFQRLLVGETINQLLSVDRDCINMGRAYLSPSSQQTLTLIKELLAADEIVNLRIVK